MESKTETQFAPQLFLPKGIMDISFYEHAFDAVERRRFSNADGSIHVAELSIGERLFHLHEEKPEAGQFSPLRQNGTTVLIGLFVENVDAVVLKSLAAGATLLEPAQSYGYGYRQAVVKDPFGHRWLIEMHI